MTAVEKPHLRPRRAAFHKENDGVKLDGLDDTRPRIIDVNDVRHKSVSRHGSDEFVDIRALVRRICTFVNG